MFKCKPVYAHTSLKAQNKCLLLCFVVGKTQIQISFFFSPTFAGYTVQPFAAVT